jgi:hypothetical protein
MGKNRVQDYLIRIKFMQRPIANSDRITQASISVLGTTFAPINHSPDSLDWEVSSVGHYQAETEQSSATQLP